MELPLRPHHYEPQNWEVGMDFGSTFSAASFCLTSASTDFCPAGIVQAISRYMCARGDSSRTKCDVPTKVRYEKGGRHVRWGWDVTTCMSNGIDKIIPGDVIELFKPGLDDHERTQTARHELGVTLATLPFDKSVDEVVVDFITKLLQHVKARLSAVGYEDGDTVHIICTVPAIWSIRARRRTIKAVEEAKKASGFTVGKNVSLCSEPEAAAAYVFHKFGHIKLKKGDTFVVCDAGGVTVDVITYVTMRENPLCLKEVVRGTGDFCGSSELNRGFRAQVQERLKDVEDVVEKHNGKPVEQLIEDIVSDFELYFKRDFTGIDVEESDGPKNENIAFAYVPISGLTENPERGFGDGQLAITRDHLEAVFRPVLKNCWNLVEAQFRGAYDQRREPTRLLLVGGFCGSERLQRHMQGGCKALATDLQRRRITVLVPPAPGNAIAEGSIYRFLNRDMVEDHVSRSSICITQHDPLDKRQKAHKDSCPVFDVLESPDYVPDCVKILLKTDQMIPSTGLTKTIHLHCTITANEEILELAVPIYVMDGGNGADDYPISHPSNKGYERLETASFKVEVAPIRQRLKQMKYGTSVPGDQSIQSQRRSTRTRKGSLRHRTTDQSISRSSPGLENSTEHLQDLPSPSSESDLISDRIQDPASYYFWVDYRVEVEFKDGLMTYRLFIKNVDKSFKGEVNLDSILEPFQPENMSLGAAAAQPQ
ncbi:hypothetical protein K469DRAFT_748795 [Zopfia rhizophila CBS 207.26]|uniref:Actin-like ATPase domain-containing protein n=1 Tax=Zopfia rhizophila CBS 207.26 TaxID=1314779 RepID=A0A6A6EBR6_9PEZI|nr:hypothetical protein K469DRAFT_748795 [Zopfia rhizophila CBS 207.26]